MSLDGPSQGGLIARRRRVLALGLLLAGLLALIAAGAPGAAAGPAQEEYRLSLPDARGGEGGSPSEARWRMHLGGSAPPESASGGTSSSPDRTLGSGGAANGDGSSDHDPLLGRSGQVGDSDLISAGTSAVGKTPMGLAILAALALITLAGLLAARRRGANVLGSD